MKKTIMNKKGHKKMNICMECKGLTEKEKRHLLEIIRKINKKRRRDNMPRLLYRLDFRC